MLTPSAAKANFSEKNKKASWIFPSEFIQDAFYQY
jgi:hypothetical protein